MEPVLHQAAGKRMKAAWLLVPHRPNRLPSRDGLRKQLQAETIEMEMWSLKSYLKGW
jgi:hypothetical protein